MAQTSRPSSTISSEWQPLSNVHTTVDEVLADDSDYGYCTDDGDGEPIQMTVGMSSIDDPVSAADHYLVIRGKSRYGAGDVELTVNLIQIGSPDATVATETFSVGSSTTFTTYTKTLSSSEANAISDYGALKVQVIAVDQDEADAETWVSWLYFQTGDAGSSSSASTLSLLGVG